MSLSDAGLMRIALAEAESAAAEDEVPIGAVVARGGVIIARAHNVTSERDLADALERVTRYITERDAEIPKIRPLRAEPAQNPPNRDLNVVETDPREVATTENAEWRRAESDRGPRDYETGQG